ncbi:hypothetical protein RJ640_029444 [Escallonia rubra]|uniref:Cytochrome P450 n=1 Tax=Escallonia rubra TaxID=112253 RepID=A0AA88RBJ2_9ASTE|nr:hypothetical protein RJ640_029444 [Escallonia rubra]
MADGLSNFFVYKQHYENQVCNFIDSISSSTGHSINLTEKIYKLTSCITSRAMFGKECKDASEFVKDIFGAGTDTTATTTEWAMAELLKDPTIMEKAQAEVRKVLEGKSKICEQDIQELNYLKFVIKETLRLHPPAPLAPRE